MYIHKHLQLNILFRTKNQLLLLIQFFMYTLIDHILLCNFVNIYYIRIR